MYPITLFSYLLTLFSTPTIAVSPSTSATSATSASAMLSRFTHSDDCALPQTPATCAGAPQKDVIVHYGKNTTVAERALLLNAARAAGGKIHEAMESFGFTAFVPKDVVELISAHGKTCGVSVYENGCAGIPWCGEAPC